MNAAISMTFMPSRSFRAMCFLLFQKDCRMAGVRLLRARRLRDGCPAEKPNGWRAMRVHTARPIEYLSLTPSASTWLNLLAGLEGHDHGDQADDDEAEDHDEGGREAARRIVDEAVRRDEDHGADAGGHHDDAVDGAEFLLAEQRA